MLEHGCDEHVHVYFPLHSFYGEVLRRLQSKHECEHQYSYHSEENPCHHEQEARFRKAFQKEFHVSSFSVVIRFPLSFPYVCAFRMCLSVKRNGGQKDDIYLCGTNVYRSRTVPSPPCTALDPLLDSASLLSTYDYERGRGKRTRGVS